MVLSTGELVRICPYDSPLCTQKQFVKTLKLPLPTGNPRNSLKSLTDLGHGGEPQPQNLYFQPSSVSHIDTRVLAIRTVTYSSPLIYFKSYLMLLHWPDYK